MLDQGRLRNAADEAWVATKGALILARTEEPRTSGQTMLMLRQHGTAAGLNPSCTALCLRWNTGRDIIAE